MKRRGIFFGIAIALAVHVLLAVQVFRARQGEDAWLVGASPLALRSLAEEKIEQAVDLLNGLDGPVEARLLSYRSRLAEAEEYLVRSLEALPQQPRTLARLAAVRFEESPGSSPDSILAMISLAARLAPEAPAIQEQMGTLLLRMGQPEAAEGYLRKAVNLDPSRALGVVSALSQDRATPDEILEILPRGPDVLVALQRPFHDAGRVAEYADLLEQSLPGSVALLRAYGRARLVTKDAARLVDTLERLGPGVDRGVETERLVLLSRAHQAQGAGTRAIEHARSASKIAEEDPAVFENLGVVALAAGDPAAAVAAFRDALSKLARRRGSVADRARLYRMIGAAEEKQGARNRAYDAYKKALALDPADSLSARRVLDMETAAGLPAPEKR